MGPATPLLMSSFTWWSQGHRKMSPFCIPFAIHNMGGAQLAMDLGFMGPNYPINTACATGNYCILKCGFLKRGSPNRFRCIPGLATAAVAADAAAAADPSASRSCRRSQTRSSRNYRRS